MAQSRCIMKNAYDWENDLNPNRYAKQISMSDLHSKVCECVSHLIGIAQFNNSEASMKNTEKGLDFMYKSGGFDQNYIKILVGFYNYIKNHKLHICEHIEVYKLAKLISVVRNPPKAFPIGSRVCHTRRGYKDCSLCFTPDNITYEYGIVDDYDYTVNQYQLKYDNGSTVGWIQEKDLKQIEA